MSKYTCHSSHLGDSNSRGGATIIVVQDGYIRAHPLLESHIKNNNQFMRQPVYKIHISNWNPIACGYLERVTDSLCDNCINQFKV